MNWHLISQWLINFPKNYLWLFEVIIVIFVTLIISLIAHFLLNRLTSHLKKTQKIWDDALFLALHRPLQFLIWLLGVTYAGDLIRAAHTSLRILYGIDPVRHIGIVLFFLWFAIRFISIISTRLVHPDYREKPLDKTSVDAISKLLILLSIVMAFLAILQAFHIGISAFLAFLGGGAFVLGFGAKDLLANFFGGLIIYWDSPFSIGDWIVISEKNIEGTVEDIGWRLTRIRTFDKRPLYVPNSFFSAYAIENPSRMTNRRIKTTFGLRYCDSKKVNDIIADIEDMLHNHPEIDTRQTLFVKLIEFAPSYLNFQIYTFTKTTQWVKFQSIQQDVFLKILEIVEKHGAQMAFPTQTLDVSYPLPVEVTLSSNTRGN